jgi:peptidoglycan hydrolase-like protein with peptidoglycan-binding domain
MLFTDTLLSLVEQDQVEATLFRGSKASWAIRAFQVSLFQLGFSEEMNWAAFMADGDYGGGTTRAVRAFLDRNGIEGNEEKVNAAIVKRIVLLAHAREDLAYLRQAMANGSISEEYAQFGGKEQAIKGLQRMLYTLGYGEQLNWGETSPSGQYDESTQRAVKAFGSAEGMPNDGSGLNTALAKKLKDRMQSFYGEKLDLIPDTAGQGGRRASDVTVREIGSKLYAWDTYFKIRLRRHSRGVYIAGGEKADSFVELYAAALKEAGLSDSGLRVMLPVSVNEGALDAVNTWDNAFLSFGMFQWTLGTGGNEGELPALLNRLKRDDPDTFRNYFARYGLEVEEAETNEVYGRVKLNGAVVRSSSDKEQLRDNGWAFRFWRAGLDPMVKLSQVMHAFHRLYTFYHHSRYLVKGKYFVDQIVTSEYGVALILDHHVNRPAHPRKHLGQAMDQTGLASKDPATWSSDDERRLIKAYLAIRAQSSMTHPEDRAARTRRFLTAGKLSDERGSFSMAPKTRSLDAGVFPRGLSEANYPIIRDEEEMEGAEENAAKAEASDGNAQQLNWWQRLWKSLFG